MQKSRYEHRNSTDTRQSTCYIGTLYSQANIMVKMLKISYVKRQLAHDSENKISFVAYFWTIWGQYPNANEWFYLNVYCWLFHNDWQNQMQYNVSMLIFSCT